jgi:O-antigen ligase
MTKAPAQKFGLAELIERARPGVLPGFLIACVAFGGASQENAIQSSALPLVAVFCLFWLAFDRRFSPMPKSARVVVWFAAAFVAIALIQLVPLPPDLWAHLPGRAGVKAGFEALGVPLPWLPLSLAPEKTISATLQILPPLAVFLIAVKSPWRQAIAPIAWLLPLLGAASVALGVAQVLGGEKSPLYLYPTTNRDAPVGFFSNTNHLASFLVLCVPFVGVLLGRLRRSQQSGNAVVERVVFAVSLGGLCIAGVAIAGSLAGYILLLPALIAAFGIARKAKTGSGGDRRSVLAFFFGMLALAMALATSPYVLRATSSFDSALADGNLSRPELFARTIEGIEAQWPIGAGLGAFREAYPRFENADIVTSRYANHAHNDYLEFVFDAGVMGACLILAVLIWWGRRTVGIWTSALDEEGRMRRAASVAIAIVVLHSLVDYPLRTTASAAVAAFCLAVMISVRSRAGPGEAAIFDPPNDNDRNVVI